MKPETIALHGGFDSDPTTKAVAVPIYQTVAYSFDSAAHGAALFNLEVEGYRYTRIGNPTSAVLERRVAELEGGDRRAERELRADGAVLHGAERCSSRVATSSPCRSSTARRTRCSPTCCRSSACRCASRKSDRAAELEALIDENTRAVFCETVGNPAGNVCDLEALAAVAHRGTRAR